MNWLADTFGLTGTMSSGTVSGNLQVSGNLSVTGNLNVSGDVTASGLLVASIGLCSKYATASAAIGSANLTSAFGFGPVTAGRGFIGDYADVTTAASTVYEIRSNGVNWHSILTAYTVL